MDAHAPTAVRQIEEETFSLLATEYARVAAKRRGLREGTTEYNYHVRTWADEIRGMTIVRSQTQPKAR